MDTPTHSQLQRLAELHGLQLSYTDIGGNTQVAREGPLRKCLAALGVELDSGGTGSLADALARGEAEQWSQMLPPVVVAWEGSGSVSIRVPASCTGRYALEAVGDDGAVRSEGRIEDLPVHSGYEAGAQAFVQRSVSLPGPLAPGYYQLHLRAPGLLPPASLLISAPRRVFAPASDHRGWGMFVPLYALKTQRDHGVGDFTDLRRLTQWVGDRGGSMVGTLPLLATFLDEPYEPSPYSPASRLAWNELHLDVEALPEYALSPVAKRAFSDADAAEARAKLRAATKVDHRAAMALKRRALAPMAEVCWSNGGPRRAALEAFLTERPEIDAYAKFRAVGATRGESWHVWPATIQRGNIPERSFDPKHYRYHAYVQWAVHEQLQALSKVARDQGSGLYLDLPVGVHGDGFDPWLYPDAFVGGLSTGAPPDALFAGGQNWAFPPPSPHRQRQNHYRYLTAVLQNHLRYAGVLRIDHVMGLHRLFVIPAHAPASDGMYLRFPAPELYALLSLESHRSQTVLIGENLGTVPDEVQHAMDTHGVHGMHVVQYQARRDPNAALPDAAAGDVASLNTHDMPPFTAYWTGADLDVQQQLGFIDEGTREHIAGERADQRACLTAYLGQRSNLQPGAEASEAVPALMRHLGQSDARLVLVNLEDLWGETHAQNVPGTWREHANWQHRTRFDFETWSTDEAVLAPLKELQAARAEASYRGEVRYDVSQLGDEDLHYWNEGTHARVDDQLGAHPMTVDGLRGTSFAVWAPGATYVSVIGDFNHWDRGKTPLKARGSSGIWEGFVIGVGPGELYKLHVASEHASSDRADPFAFATEEPPRTASKIADLSYTWEDQAWMDARAKHNATDAPMSIYEVHLGSWRRVPEEGDRMLSYRELSVQLVDYVRDMGFTHVEMLPVMEHPFYGSWGYQTTGYFAPSARQGSPADFKALIDAFHAAGIGVLLDWVPSHFPTDAFALSEFDGTHLYEHADPKQGFHPDWNTAIFNYDRHEVRAYLQSSARFWCEAYHADGLRVDAVASMLYLDYSREEGQWVPNRYGGRENLGAIEALRQINETVYTTCPGAVTIAEESTSWPLVSHPTDAGGLGFGFKWDMGWMHDTLSYFGRDPIHRKHHQNELTFRMMYAFGENYVLPISHDEVVHGKGSVFTRMPGDEWQKFANMRALYGYMYGQPGKKLLFMGCEFGQTREWNHDASLDWHLLQHDQAHGRHEGVRRWVADLNRLHRAIPALHQRDCDPGGFAWVDIEDADASVLTFLRWDQEGVPVLVVCNLTPMVREDYGVGVPHGGWWHELANSDAAEYGGSGVGNEGGRHAIDDGLHGHPHRLSLRLPPLSVSFFSPQDPR